MALDMKTEDDTFRILKRIPYEDIKRIRKQELIDIFIEISRGNKLESELDNFEKYGWTREEYNKMFYEKEISPNRMVFKL